MKELDNSSLAELLAAAESCHQPVSQLIIDQQADQMNLPPAEVYRLMAERFQVMKAGVETGTHTVLRSTSGLSGGDAVRMQTAVDSGKTICGPFLAGALARALAVSELNASMGKIVAAPTAGSCGILPAALCTMEAEQKATEDQCVRALFTAGAVGMVIAQKASVSGAQGGCQAEIGSASAMAAAALTELAGGTPEQIGNAVAIAIQNILGLVCDPVAGLVEIPCILRNASGVGNAFIAAELAMAGIRSAIPVDEVILAMKKVGDAMPCSMKETAEGGLASTPTAKKLYEQVFGTAGAGGCSGCDHSCK